MSSSDGPTVESGRFYPWRVKRERERERERENLRLIFDEIISKREFNLFGYLVEDHRD